MRLSRALMLTCALCAGPLAAREDVPKLSVSGDTIYYDTANANGPSTDIEAEDVPVLRALLKANPQVRILELNSGGGSVWASQTMSDIVIDYELDTRVNGDCDSSCVLVFLAGENRSMTRGSRNVARRWMVSRKSGIRNLIASSTDISWYWPQSCSEEYPFRGQFSSGFRRLKRVAVIRS